MKTKSAQQKQNLKRRNTPRLPVVYTTEEMKIYNHIASNYEECLLGGRKNDALQIARNVQEYLKALPHNTKMYGDGKRWTTSSELIEYNKTRINRLEREVYSVELGGAHRRNDKQI